MKQLDVPIIHKTYELYRMLHDTSKSVPKSERYTLWQRCEENNLRVLETLLQTSYLPQDKRVAKLKQASVQVDMLRVLLRLAHDIQAIK